MENYIGFIVGLITITLNKPFYQMITWSNREVFGMKNEYPEGLARGFIVFIGLLFILIGFLKIYR
jgi:hypothetical protein